MALITKGYTFSAGGTILSAEVNSDFDTIYADYNGNVTNANVASGAAIVDTKLAQITTAGKVSGAALTSLGSIPTQTDTTTNSFLLASNSLTTGTAMTLSSSATAITGAGRILYVNHTGTTGTSATLNEFTTAATDETILLKATASAALTGTILQVSGATIATASAITASDLNALTTGIGLHLASSATAITGAGRLLYSNHTGATGTTATLNEFATAANDETTLLKLTASSLLALGTMLDISGATVTTGTLLDVGDADALTTGFIANLVSNSSSTATRTLVKIHNDHTSADDTEVLKLIQDGDDFALYVDYNATVSDTITGIRIDGCDVANGANTVTISNVAPAGVGTATIDSWLVVDIAGTRKYIPMWT